MSPDVVVILREHARREELQFGLRSLANIPHGKVWLVGGKPDWVRNVEHVPMKDGKDKWQNISDKFRLCRDLDGLSDEFIYTEDDYFIIRPFRRLPRFIHPKVTLEARVAEEKKKRHKLNGWGAYLDNTLTLLREHGIDDPLSFDVHVPMYVKRSKMPDWTPDRPVSWRSICGNLDPRNPIAMSVDCKATVSLQWQKVKDADEGFLSSSDVHFRRIGMEKFMERLFPDPCKYEQEGA